MVYVCDTSCHGVLFENREHKVKHMHSTTFLKSSVSKIINNNNNTTVEN